MYKQYSRVLVGALIACCLVATASNAVACKVPVFRYALEHWNPDAYRAVILHRGTLSPADEALAAKLESRVDQASGSVNVVVDRVDVAKVADEIPLLAKTLGDDYRNLESPEIVLYYPEHSQSGPLAWRGKLSAQNIDALVDSPARKQITEWIIAGESAVWVLIGSGDKKQDAAAEEKLSKELARLEKEIKLTDIEIIKAEKEFGEDTKVDLRLGFKLIKIDRNDPLEKILAETLLRSEDDLMELKEPIAIPVFGRGRSHLALVGKGINSGMIEESCRFLAGDCSCEVKRQNPGVDLVFDVNWDELVVGSAGSDQELPPLSGVGLYNEIKLDEEEDKQSADKTAAQEVDEADKKDAIAKKDPKKASEPEDKPTPNTDVADDGQKPKENAEPTNGDSDSGDPKQSDLKPVVAAMPVPAKPATSEVAMSREVAAANTAAADQGETSDPKASVTTEPEKPFVIRLLQWITGLIAIGSGLVLISLFWLRTKANDL